MVAWAHHLQLFCVPSFTIWLFNGRYPPVNKPMGKRSSKGKPDGFPYHSLSWVAPRQETRLASPEAVIEATLLQACRYRSHHSHP